MGGTHDGNAWANARELIGSLTRRAANGVAGLGRRAGLAPRATTALLVVATGLFLLICLAKFGAAGAAAAGDVPWHLAVAGWFVSMFGVGAWLLVVLPTIWGVIVYFREDTPNLVARGVGVLVLACATAALTGLLQAPVPGPAAGAIGEFAVWGAGRLADVVGRPVAQALVWTGGVAAFVTSLIWATDWMFHTVRRRGDAPVFSLASAANDPLAVRLREEYGAEEHEVHPDDAPLPAHEPSESTPVVENLPAALNAGDAVPDVTAFVQVDLSEQFAVGRTRPRVRETRDERRRPEPLHRRTADADVAAAAERDPELVLDRSDDFTGVEFLPPSDELAVPETPSAAASSRAARLRDLEDGLLPVRAMSPPPTLLDDTIPSAVGTAEPIEAVADVPAIEAETAPPAESPVPETREPTADETFATHGVEARDELVAVPPEMLERAFGTDVEDSTGTAEPAEPEDDEATAGESSAVEAPDAETAAAIRSVAETLGTVEALARDERPADPSETGSVAEPAAQPERPSSGIGLPADSPFVDEFFPVALDRPAPAADGVTDDAAPVPATDDDPATPHVAPASETAAPPPSRIAATITELADDLPPRGEGTSSFAQVAEVYGEVPDSAFSVSDTVTSAELLPPADSFVHPSRLELEDDPTVQPPGPPLGERMARLATMQVDPLFTQAVDAVLDGGRGSAMVLQRRLGIGHARGLRILGQMEAAGLIGAEDPTGSRDVLVSREEWAQFVASA